MITPVILSGGAGTRLWPLSRELYPKQLLALLGERTMLQETILRTRGLNRLAPPLVVCNEAHRFLVAEQLREIGVKPSAIVLEPVGRNTAPAVALAAIRAIDCSADSDPLLLVLPADHVISDVHGFHEAIAAAQDAAEADRLVTFGVVPSRPETGYGYIKAIGKGSVREISQFVEKPEKAVAVHYVKSGDYLWNSGMFMFRASAFLKELREHNPAILEACTAAMSQAREDLDFLRLDEEAFRACPSDSIDYAVMEKTALASVVPLEAGWSDVGSWASLHEASGQDEDGNVFRGDVLAHATRNSFVFSESRLVATVGLDDHIVVETKDAVLVARRDRVQDVKAVVEKLRAAGRDEADLHRQVFRPWGSYDSVDEGEGFQVKRLIVNPGAILSLQMHHHRAEHWVVVRGTAKVTRGKETFLIHENESTFIPQGEVHRIENPGKVPLHVIEVQSGSYLGEDDIVRFEDTYGRTGETPKG